MAELMAFRPRFTVSGWALAPPYRNEIVAQQRSRIAALMREAVAHLRNALQMSERRPCSLIAADRTMVRYRSRRAPEVELRTRLGDLANHRRRFGYRRLFILLREQGGPSGINCIYRLFREEGIDRSQA